MYVLDAPQDFAHEASEGFVTAYSRYVERVPGAWAVMRSGGPRNGKVSVVIGGGSGHYPASCGLVGAGLADAAVLGEVFTSPSAEQVYRTAKTLDGGAGILFSYGNYAGDVLNFNAAQTRLRADGVDCRTVVVSDDIASAPADEVERRRGIAGSLAVYKFAGAAAERGDQLDEVERLARLGNSRTFSYGAAFEGCTLPGADAPLFTVPAGLMELGLGIHGEQGIQTVARADARSLARQLVEPLLAERPPDSDGRAAVLLNGLGSTKYEELFVLFDHVRRLLGDAGVRFVLPEVGEFVTSLDMAGVSLTIAWLDDELDELWCLPTDTPAFRRRALDRSEELNTVAVADAELGTISPRSDVPEGAASAGAIVVRRALAAMLAAVTANEALLSQLDAITGDGDHGTAMVRGMRAACAASDLVTEGAGATLGAAADAFADRGAGTSGMLWGVFLRAIGESVGNGPLPSAVQLVTAVDRGADEVSQAGGARRGDKTMLDSLLAFSECLGARVDTGESIAEAWAAAAAQASQAATGTAQMVARLGRARPLAQKGLGTPDPGATSMALCLQAVGAIFAPDTGAQGDVI